MNDFNKLREIVAALRGPDGCPWDRKQTLYSMKDDFLEEAYEFIEALENNDIENICEELGDVLLHVVIHSQIAEEESLFSIDDVTDTIVKKLVRRHPHVFGDVNIDDADEVLKKWEEIKALEKKGQGVEAKKGVLSKANKPAPALVKSIKLQSAAAKVGFDWPTAEAILEKATEELDELKEACETGQIDMIKEELGDVLFIVANLARHIGISADEALKNANKKFVRRFEYVEARLEEQGKTPQDSTLEEMDSYWNEIRAEDKKRQY